MDVVSYALAKKYVDDSIANITERGQADWNQNDSAASDYVKNRPFYEIPREVIYDGSLEFKLNIQGHNPYQAQSIEVKKPFEVGKIYIITINEEECLCVCEEGADGNRINLHHNFLNGGYGYIYYSDFSWKIYIQPNGYDDFTIYLTIEEAGAIYKLDEKFIPDSIARVNDILEQSQSDWNQNDPNAPDYVKNRTHYETVNEEEVTVATSVALARDPSVVAEICAQRKTAKYFFEDGSNDNPVYQYSHDGTTTNWYVSNGIFQIEIDAYNDKIFAIKGNRTVTVHITYVLKTPGRVHKLDEKFIPDTIARVSDISEAVSTDDEIVDILIQEDMLFAFIDSTGSILTDENNNILTW